MFQVIYTVLKKTTEKPATHVKLNTTPFTNYRRSDISAGAEIAYFIEGLSGHKLKKIKIVKYTFITFTYIYSAFFIFLIVFFLLFFFVV